MKMETEERKQQDCGHEIVTTIGRYDDEKGKEGGGNQRDVEK
jgi:hypothetical protein